MTLIQLLFNYIIFPAGVFFFVLLLSMFLWSIFYHFLYPQPHELEQHRLNRALDIIDNFLRNMSRFPILTLIFSGIVYLLCSVLRLLARVFNTPALHPHHLVSQALADPSVLSSNRLHGALIRQPAFWLVMMDHLDTITNLVKTYAHFFPNHSIDAQQLGQIQQLFPIFQTINADALKNNDRAQIAHIIAKGICGEPLHGQDFVLCAQIIGKIQKHAKAKNIDITPIMTHLSSLLPQQCSDMTVAAGPVPSSNLTSCNSLDSELSSIEDKIVDTYDLVVESSWQSCLKSTKNVVVGFASSLSDYASRQLNKLITPLNGLTWINQYCVRPNLSKGEAKSYDHKDKTLECLSRPSLWRRILSKSRQLHARINWLRQSQISKGIKCAADWILGDDLFSVLNRTIAESVPADSALVGLDNFSDIIIFSAELLSDDCINSSDLDTLSDCIALAFSDPCDSACLTKIDLDKCLVLFNKVKNSRFVQTMSPEHATILDSLFTNTVHRWISLNLDQPLAIDQSKQLSQCLKALIMNNSDDHDLCAMVSELSQKSFSRMSTNQRSCVLFKAMNLLGKNEHLLQDHETLGSCLDASMMHSARY